MALTRDISVVDRIKHRAPLLSKMCAFPVTTLSDILGKLRKKGRNILVNERFDARKLEDAKAWCISEERTRK